MPVERWRVGDGVLGLQDDRGLARCRQWPRGQSALATSSGSPSAGLPHALRGQISICAHLLPRTATGGRPTTSVEGACNRACCHDGNCEFLVWALTASAVRRARPDRSTRPPAGSRSWSRLRRRAASRLVRRAHDERGIASSTAGARAAHLAGSWLSSTGLATTDRGPSPRLVTGSRRSGLLLLSLRNLFTWRVGRRGDEFDLESVDVFEVADVGAAGDGVAVSVAVTIRVWWLGRGCCTGRRGSGG